MSADPPLETLPAVPAPILTEPVEPSGESPVEMTTSPLMALPLCEAMIIGPLVFKPLPEIIVRVPPRESLLSPAAKFNGAPVPTPLLPGAILTAPAALFAAEPDPNEAAPLPAMPPAGPEVTLTGPDEPPVDLPDTSETDPDEPSLATVEELLVSADDSVSEPVPEGEDGPIERRRCRTFKAARRSMARWPLSTS